MKTNKDLFWSIFVYSEIIIAISLLCIEIFDFVFANSNTEKEKEFQIIQSWCTLSFWFAISSMNFIIILLGFYSQKNEIKTPINNLINKYYKIIIWSIFPTFGISISMVLSDIERLNIVNDHFASIFIFTFLECVVLFENVFSMLFFNKYAQRSNVNEIK